MTHTIGHHGHHPHGTFVKRMSMRPTALECGVKPAGLLIVTNVDWFFLSHRVPIARAAIAAGYDVHVAAADTGRADEVEALGATFHPLPFTRSGAQPLHELRAIMALGALYRRIKPAILHHVSIKPSLYGTIASVGVPRAIVINALSGFGFTVEGGSRVFRALTLAAYRLAFALRRPYVLVQNDDHAHMIERMRLTAPGRVVTIYGSGVDTGLFRPRDDPSERSRPVVMMTGRMLRDKGIEEFMAAARTVQAKQPHVRFVMVGPSDDDNPTAVSREDLEAACASSNVEWWGHRDDIPDVLRQADVYVAPSHHEGLPKALLEAAATALPLVATDIAGHRPVVTPANGILVPRRDPTRLAKAILELLDLPHETRLRMGRQAREHSLAFSVDTVVRQTLDLYHRVLGARG